MNSFTRAHNSYLNPPDEPEAIFCDECGVEMEEVNQDLDHTTYTKCNNEWCPGKFTEGTNEWQMAQVLVEARDEIETLKAKVKRGNRDTEHLLELGQQYEAGKRAAFLSSPVNVCLGCGAPYVGDEVTTHFHFCSVERASR